MSLASRSAHGFEASTPVPVGLLRSDIALGCGGLHFVLRHTQVGQESCESRAIDFMRRRVLRTGATSGSLAFRSWGRNWNDRVLARCGGMLLHGRQEYTVGGYSELS